MKTLKVTLTFPADKSTRPVTCYLIRDYNLVFNILQARIDMGMEGTLTMELTGDEPDLRRGLDFIRAEGIDVKEITRSIIWDSEKCTSCGACTAVCSFGALVMDESDHLAFDTERCVVCERCIAACPMGVLQMNRG